MVKKDFGEKKKSWFIGNNKGVTLIALVITIIVLIILAGVSISALTGEKSIIGQAKGGKEDTRIATIKEVRDLWQVDKEADNAMTLSELSSDLRAKKVISQEEADELSLWGQITAKRKYGPEEVIVFDEEKVADKKSIILRYETGFNGKVELPFFCDDIPYDFSEQQIKDLYVTNNVNYTVKWDDNTIEERGVSHIYSPNTTVDIKISGNINYMYQSWNDSLIEVVNWGETGLEEFSFYSCSNLIKIASPTNKSFEKIKRFAACEDLNYPADLDGAFESTGILQIPEGMFDNCPNVTSFDSTFCGTKITKIPNALFAKCPNVTSFGSTFAFTNITEIPAGLFDKCPNVTSFGSTFASTNITEIPAGLFNKCPNVTSFGSTFVFTNITEIPEGLFDKCLNVTNFRNTFCSCKSLSGTVPNLWARCSNKVTYDSKDPDGEGCYGDLNSSKITNYNDIPPYWTYYEEPE